MATTDAVAVGPLAGCRGATLMGQTHMVEFAFSGVGTNSVHHHTGSHGCLVGRDLGDVYVPGGSRCGGFGWPAAALGWGLGSDTGLDSHSSST